MKSFYAPVLGLLFCLFLAVHPVAAKETLSDDQIKQILIQQSISSYPGNCPCP